MRVPVGDLFGGMALTFMTSAVVSRASNRRDVASRRRSWKWKVLHLSVLQHGASQVVDAILIDGEEGLPWATHCS